MSKALQQISKSPFVRRINKAKLPHWFSQPTFTIYNGRTNLVEHVSHFNQKMAIHSSNETLMCKVRFKTCSRVPKLVDSLLSMAMRERETLKTYSDRYWETYNEIDRNFENMAVRTFKVRLPVEHELRKSLTMKSALNMCHLMDGIDKYKRVEEDQIQGKGKVKMFLEKRDSRGGGYQSNHPRRDFSNQTSSTGGSVGQFVI